MEARPEPRHSREPSVGSTLPSFMYSILHGDAEWKGCTVAGNPLQLTSPPSTRAGIVCGRHRRAAAPLDGAQVERLHALFDDVARLVDVRVQAEVAEASGYRLMHFVSEGVSTLLMQLHASCTWQPSLTHSTESGAGNDGTGGAGGWGVGLGPHFAEP